METDRQPLETIFKKPMYDHEALNRLQHRLLGLQSYDLMVSFRKGSEFDTLSTVYVPAGEVYQVSGECLQQFAWHAARYQTMQQLTKLIPAGWQVRQNELISCFTML